MNSFETTDKPNVSSVRFLNSTDRWVNNKCNLICLDETATEWIQNETTHFRERTLKYKVPYDSAFFGKNTISSRESQVRSDQTILYSIDRFL